MTMKQSNKTYYIIFLSIIIFTPVSRAVTWSVSFSTSNYIIKSSTEVAWNSAGYVELEKKSKRVLYTIGNPPQQDEIPGNSNWEFGFQFVSEVDGYVTKLYRYSLANSTDNAIVHFWNGFGPMPDEWARLVATATIQSSTIYWQWVAVSTQNCVFKSAGATQIKLDGGNIYLISINVNSTTPSRCAMDDPGSGGPLTDDSQNIISLTRALNGVLRTSPGYPIDQDTFCIYGIPDFEFTFYCKDGVFESQVYDTGVSAPVYKTYVSSQTTVDPLDPTDTSTVQWQFAVSSKPAGPFSSFLTCNDGDLSAVPSKRYLKFRANLIASEDRKTAYVYGININYNRTPSTFTINSPADGAIVGTNNPLFSWNPSYDVDGETVTYTVQISSDYGFMPLHVSSSGIITNSFYYTDTGFFSSKPLTDLTTYFWRICAIDKTGDSCGWLGPYSFILDYVSAFQIKSSFPADEDRLFVSDLTGKNPAYYDIDICFNKQFNPATAEASRFGIVNENDDPLDFNFHVWVNSVTLSVSTTTVPTIENSMMYTINISTSLEVDGSPEKKINAPFELDFVTLISTTSINSFGGIGSGYDYELTIPKGATPGPIYVQRRELTEDTDDGVQQANVYAKINALLKLVTEKAYSFNVTDENAAPVDSFSNAITLELSYTDIVADDDYVYDVSDPRNPVIKTESLKIFRLGDDYNWQLVTDQTQDKANRRLSAGLTGLSVFSILAYNSTGEILSGLKNMPNPFKAGEEETTIYYILSRDCIVTVKIYNLIGDLVKEIIKDTQVNGMAGGTLNRVKWDGRNSLRREVADGCYLCYVTAGYTAEDNKYHTEKQLLKIAVMK